ncbi:MAG: ABC transporter substrate-binding protein, partial [Alcaligenaceae bacterium]|nr:ABC transporter substrate-binding protein [Alcaligenaceae bacterium]
MDKVKMQSVAHKAGAKQRRARVGMAVALALATMQFAQADAGGISDNLVKIGVLTDMSGPYSDFTGAGAVTAAQMAVEDFKKNNPDFMTPVEVVSADHQNKVDIGMARANAWFDVDKVDMITELVTSNVALAVSNIAAQKNRVALVTGAASLPLTNEQCNKNTVHWVYDTYALSNGTAKYMLDSGKKNWYFITVNYTFGSAMMDAAG